VIDMANYKSAYTGTQIDAGIAKANTAIQDVSNKQDTLVSGANIKTINNTSILGSGNINIEGGSTEDYTPYIFDYNFKTGDYEALSGITEVTDGVTVTNGFNNKVVINKYISADDVSYYADVTLQDLNTVLCLSSVESNGGIHSSIVTFDFNNALISVYPKTNGSSIPSSPYKTLTLTNVSGLSYKIEVGRKNRDFYARLTNNTTGIVEEIVIGDESEGATAYKYPVGWLHDYVAFSQISGNSATWHRVYAYLPKRDVVFLGDSITEGYGVAWNKAWVTLVADEIGHEKVLNMGSSGDQISQCQSIVDTVLVKLKPKVVVVTIGTNGGNTDANVKALYDSIINLGAYPIFNYIYRGSNSVSANSCIAKLKCEGARFDYETSIDYDLSKGMNSTYYQTDGLHLSDDGNEAVAQRFLKDCSWIKEFVEKFESGSSEDVEKLKTDMDTIYSELEMEASGELIKKTTFYKGVAINGNNGAEMSSPTWASSREYIQGKSVRCTNSDYQFVGRFYTDDTGTYSHGTNGGVRYTNIDIPNNLYAKLSVLRVDGAELTDADATAISDAIEFITIDAGSVISMRLKDIEDRLTALENQQ
jgi:lysophospholipase L1-like esterase